MKSSALERKFLVCLIVLFAACLPLLFSACGGGIVSPASKAQQNSSPTIISVVPDTSPLTGGKVVTINGSGFTSSAQQTPPTVTFGGVAARQVAVKSSSQLTAVTPPHTAGDVAVQVTDSNGKSAAAGKPFTYAPTSPTLTGVLPSSGPVAGGTVVTLAGTNFVSGATVSFGGTATSGVSFVSSTQLKATTPAHNAGQVAVTVTNPDGTDAILSNAFTYVSSSSLTISSVSPNSGPVAGGTVVTVTGTNFASGATVSFGGTAATGVSFVSSTQLKATTPAHAAGTVSVTVTNPNGGSADLASAFNYVSSPPTVSSVSPISGPAAGGTTVTISGTNFQSGASVSIGGLAATSVTVSSSTTIKAVTPPHNYGSVSVVVTNSDGQSATLSSGFTYHSVTLSWDAPTSSPVTITGYDIYRSLTSGGTYAKLNGSTPVSSTTYTDTTVQGNTTYFYDVRSVDSSGTESSPDGPVQVTTGP